MNDEEPAGEEQYELPRSVGEKLREARAAKGLDLAQVAAETRINQRHLQMIENDDFVALPARTYAIGFSKTYARLVGLNERAIADEVRAQLAMLAPRSERPLTFEPGDPARVPSVRLAWLSAFAGVILFVLALGYVWTSFVSPAGSLPWLTADRQPQPAPAPQTVAPAALATSGDVIFTALDDGVWVKFYDADGRQLMQKQMARGETYAVPRDVDGPMIWTARPDALGITVGGREVPRLAETQGQFKDVPVSAEALLARPVPAAAPAAADTPSTRTASPTA